MVFPVCRVWPNPTATGPGTGGVSDGERSTSSSTYNCMQAE